MVTGSCHLLAVNGQKILLDCGLVQGGGREKARQLNESFLFNPQGIDAVILSHAHIDHAGLIPRLAGLGFNGPIYCTRPTQAIADVLLRDAAHIQQQDAKFILKEMGQVVEPLYVEADVNRLRKQFVTYEYGQKFRLAEGIWVAFYEAGHVLGSAITVLDINENGKKRRLVYTGDLGRKYLPLLNDPYQVTDADILIIESTYASHLHDPLQNVKAELARVVQDVVKRGGKIIVPGFSFERTQELVYILHELHNQNEIPTLPIFVDSPLSVAISKVFDQFREYYDHETFKTFLDKKQSPFYFQGVRYVESLEESKTLNSYQGSCVIISASGMCEAGRIQHHLRYHMTDPNNLILIVGFMAQGTRGRQIVEGQRRIKIFGQEYPLRAEVVVMNAFSGHADKTELLEYIRNIKNLETVFVVHGEETETEVMRDNLYNILKFKGAVKVPMLGEEVEV